MQERVDGLFSEVGELERQFETLLESDLSGMEAVRLLIEDFESKSSFALELKV